ncbi:MAG: HlyD family efflux transporter periplasmic adaptor subunit [Planctomycetota bacterium]
MSETQFPTADPPVRGRRQTQNRFSDSVMFNVIIPLSLLCGAAAIFLILSPAEAEKRADADTTRVGRLRALPPVRVERLMTLESMGQGLELEVDGVVVPFQEARVAAEINGRVVKKEPVCEAGGYVTAGQLLMNIDDKDYQLEVDRLKRLVEQEAQAIKELDQESLNSDKLKEIAAKDVELQEAEVKRLMTSRERGAASRAEVDQANRILLAARQQLVTVQNQYDLLRERRIRLESSKRLAETQLEAAELNVERCKILAPLEGVIVSEQADVNTFVSRGSTLVTIENTSKVEVSTSLRMDQLYWVLDQAGRDLEADSLGYDLPETPVIVEYVMNGREGTVYRWQGRLLSYDGIGLDSDTRTVPVRVVVDQPRQYVSEDGIPVELNSAPALLRGMYVRVRLLLQPRTQLVVIPARALQPGNRVLHFVPDDSVLSAAESDADSQSESPTATEDASTSEADVTQVDDRGEFDPTDWEPGRVFTRTSIYPVETLRLSGMKSQSGLNERISAEKFWVCEVADKLLEGGSFVVVSPMGDIEDEASVPVRAAKEKASEPVGDERAMTPSETRPTSVQQDVASAEDA